ncbi:MAG: hypothetical protein ACYTDY_08275 [Planctomycetota bacterium]|jgi:hypothetical protein
MEKQDFVWVGIRIFGIYLLVMAVVTVPAVLESILMANQYSDLAEVERGASEAQASFDTLVRKMYVNYVSASIRNALRLVLFTVFGLYLVRGGQLVFRLACRPL